jgi:hypothetical protein
LNDALANQEAVLSGAKTVEMQRNALAKLFADIGNVGSIPLGMTIANHITSNDPRNILVLFAHGAMMEHVSDAMHAAIRTHCLPGFLPRTNVIAAVTKDEWGQSVEFIADPFDLVRLFFWD